MVTLNETKAGDLQCPHCSLFRLELYKTGKYLCANCDAEYGVLITL